MMKFLTQQQRAEHPQASLIPKKIWNSYFNQQVTPFEIKLMQGKYKRIDINAVKWRKKTVFLCLLYAKPELSAGDILKHLPTNLERIHDALQASCIANRPDVIQALFKEYPMNINRYLEFNGFALFQYAVRYASINTIKSLFAAYTGDVVDVLSAQNYALFVACCSRTRLKTKLFDFLVSRIPNLVNELPVTVKISAFHAAIFYKNKALVHRIEALWPQGLECMLRTSVYEAYTKAATSGNIQLLRHLFSLQYHPRLDVIREGNYQIMHGVARSGHWAILNELLNSLDVAEQVQMIASHDYELLYDAALHGHVRIFNRFWALIPNHQDCALEVRLFAAFTGAAQKGCVSMLSRLFFLFPMHQNAMNAANQYAAFRKAAHCGRLSVLRFLSDKFPHKVHEMISSDNFYAFRKGVLSGHKSIIYYLWHTYPQAIGWMIAANNFEALANACYKDLAWVKKIAAKVPDRAQEWIVAHEGKALERAVASSNIPLIKYLLKLLGHQASNFVGSFLDKLAANIADVQVLKYFMTAFPEYKRALNETNNYHLFAQAIARSQLDILAYLLQEFPQLHWKMLVANKFRAAMNINRFSKDSEVARLFIDCAPNFEKVICFSDLFWHIAFHSSHSVLFKYLIRRLSPTRYKRFIRDKDFIIFRGAVAQGNLPLARFIFDSAPEAHYELIQRDDALIHEAIDKRNLEMLDFLLSYRASCNTLNLFHQPKKRAFISTSTCRYQEEATLIFNAETLFLDPNTLKITEKLHILLSCIVIGYSSIGTMLAYQLFGNKHFYCRMLLNLAASKRNSAQVLERILNFLRTKVGISEERVAYLLSQPETFIKKSLILKKAQ